MSKLLSTLVTLAWALWFGGTMTLFLTVSAIFRTFGDDRATAGNAAAGVFGAFERFQFPLALATVVLTLFWRFVTPRGRPGLKTIAIVLFALSTAAAAVETFHIAPQIDAMRVDRRTHEPAFRKLHGGSMVLYTAEAALLLAAGLLIPAAIRREEKV